MLLVLAILSCASGGGGMLWLATRWRNNYVWLLNRIYLPGAQNGLAGLIATTTSIYFQRSGNWDVPARAAVGVRNRRSRGVQCGVCPVQ